MKKKIPTCKTDVEAERFVDTADLSKYDRSGSSRRNPVRGVHEAGRAADQRQ